MNNNEIKDKIRRELKCTQLLEPSKGGLYNCPSCGSGTGANETGAVHYNKDTNTVYCFACNNENTGKQWDVFDLIQRVEGVSSFPDQVRRGAELLGIEYPSSVSRREQLVKDFDTELEEEATAKMNKAIEEKEEAQPPKEHEFTQLYEICNRSLMRSRKGAEALKYLHDRGFSDKIIELYNLGYNEVNRSIVIPCGKGWYLERLIAPGKTEGKYRNPKGIDPQLFNEGALLIGGAVFVTEGAFTALSAIECGKNALSLQSTNGGKRLLDALDRDPGLGNGAKFIICFDVDENKGSENAEKTAENTRKHARELADQLLERGYSVVNFDLAPYTLGKGSGETDLNDLLKRDRNALKAALDAAEAQEPEKKKDELDLFFDKINTEAYKPYRTGVSFVDELLGGGLVRQTLTLIMASPATGKTTLCQQIAEELSYHKTPVVYLNLEMSREQMLAKALSYRLAKKDKWVTSSEIMRGYNYTDDMRSTIKKELNLYRDRVYPYIKYNPDNVSSNIDVIKDYLERIGNEAKAKGEDAPAVILDYLHLVTGNGGDAQELIKQTVTVLKNYAINYNTFVISILATNRSSASSGKITMQSGRDSSSLEYTGDYMISMEYYLVDTGDADAADPAQLSVVQNDGTAWRYLTLRVLKSRFGETGKTEKVFFKPAYNIFYGETDFLPCDDTRKHFSELRNWFSGKKKEIKNKQEKENTPKRVQEALQL